MTRHLVALALLSLPAVASAQVGVAVPVGPPMIGGHAVIGPPIANGASALFPVQVPTLPRFSVGGGSMSGPPQVWLPSGAWGGAYYAWPVQEIEIQPSLAAGRVAVTRSAAVTTQTVVSRDANATLVVQFPAAAEIWVDGKKADGSAAIEWTLTSSVLNASGSHTFDVKGRWRNGGKTFETVRSVTVNAGDRNRSIILSGSEVK